MMKVKYVVFGCLVTILCLFGCNETDEVTLTGISISQTTINMEAGETMDLTATITPSNATEDIFWISVDQSIVSIDRYGVQTKLNALRAGTTKVFATNRTKTVLSEDINVIVNPKDFAGDVLGDYLGSGVLEGLNPLVSDEALSGVKISFERIAKEDLGDGESDMEMVNLTIEAPTIIMGHITIIGRKVIVSSNYELSNTSNLRIVGSVSFDTLTGKVDPTGKTLTMRLVMNGMVAIELTAIKQE